MKTCPKCKKEYADSVAVCPDDGTFLDLETPVAEPEAVAAAHDDEIPYAAETVDRMGTAAAETFRRDTEIAETAAVGDSRASSTNLYPVEDSGDDDYKENPTLGWILPLIIVVLLIILGYWFCGKSGAPKASTHEVYPYKIENKLI